MNQERLLDIGQLLGFSHPNYVRNQTCPKLLAFVDGHVEDALPVTGVSDLTPTTGPGQTAPGCPIIPLSQKIDECLRVHYRQTFQLPSSRCCHFCRLCRYAVMSFPTPRPRRVRFSGGPPHAHKGYGLWVVDYPRLLTDGELKMGCKLYES